MDKVCGFCGNSKPIYRKISLTDGEGELIDLVRICKECYEDKKSVIEAETWLVDSTNNSE